MSRLLDAAGAGPAGDLRPRTGPGVPALAAAVLSLGVMIAYGTRSSPSLLLVVVAIALAVVAARGAARDPIGPERLLVLLLAVNGILWALFWLRSVPSQVDGALARVAVTSAMGLLLVAGYLFVTTGRRRWGGLVVTSGLVLGLTLVVDFPTSIDVLMFQEVSSQRLLRGISPYAGSYPHDYSASQVEMFYAPGLAEGGRLRFGFPYPPLGLLAVLPAHLLGTVRLAHLGAVLATGGLLGWLGVREDSRQARLAAVLLLTSPLPYVIASRAWTEPFLALAITALLVWRGVVGRLPAALFGVALALKQYAVLLAPTLLLALDPPAERRRVVRTLLGAAAVVAITVLPFLVWDPDGMWWSVVELQFVQPYRPDSLSLLSASVETIGWPPAWTFPLLPFVAAAGVAVAAWRHEARPSGPRAAALWSAVLLLAMLLVSKQAFGNYYYLGFVLLVLGASFPDRAETDAEPADPGPFAPQPWSPARDSRRDGEDAG